MIPLRSSERTYSPATVSLLLILINILVFFLELRQPDIMRDYGIIPDRFHFSSLLTSLFIHGGWLHIVGNMWFLWIFGPAIEDLLGHSRFLIFYLLCGVAAGFTHILLNPFSPVPTIGASGAIAGVMGAYLVKFPRARINTLVPIFIFITTVEMPAAFLLIYWFLIQFFSGAGSFGYSTVSKGDVAWFAHVGGFLAGIALILMMPVRQRASRSWS